MHGAKAVILINDVFEHPGKPDEFENFGAASGPTDAGILFVQMKPTPRRSGFPKPARISSPSRTPSIATASPNPSRQT